MSDVFQAGAWFVAGGMLGSIVTVIVMCALSACK